MQSDVVTHARCLQAGGEFGYQTLGGESVFYNTTNAGKGMLGSLLPPTPAALRPKWKAGSSVEVAWGVRYNHGGGYSYRLCPASEKLTEACFQAGTSLFRLKFHFF